MMPSDGVSVTAGQLAVAIGAEMLGPATVALDRVDPMERAGPTSLTFVRDAVFAARLGASGAGAAIVSRSLLSDPVVEAALRGANRALLVVDDADLALVRILESMGASLPEAPVGVHATAWVDGSACVGAGVSVGPHATIEAGASIGEGTRILSGARVGARARIGRDCVLHHNVVVSRGCVVGDRVVLHSGVVVGADGFGYRPDATGRLVKIPHHGTVEISSDVEIGANTTIDRAKLGATTIGPGTKIDNLVQIGHGCRIGASCVICGCVGMAGSVTVGDGVMIGGGAGIKDNVSIGAGARIAACSALMDDVPAGESWLGYPARPSRDALRALAAVAQLPDVLRQLRRLDRSNGSGPHGA